MRFTRNWILATFILTFLVIIAGGVVRTTQSGMGCPDWPRCFGKWIPPTDASQLPADFEKYLSKQDIDHSFNALHTWIEYINRLLGALLGLFAIIQSFLLFRKKEEPGRAFRISLYFLLTVILTGLFGAIVVKLNLAHLSITVHLLFAIILVLIQLALLLSVRMKLFVLPIDSKMRTMLIVLIGLLFLQSTMGTLVRMYIDDISKALNYTQREVWLEDSPPVFWVHRSFSWLVLIFSLYITVKGMKQPLFKNKFVLLSLIVMLNMVAGIILFYAHMPAVAQPVHLLLACFAITQSFAILLQSKNN